MLLYPALPGTSYCYSPQWELPGQQEKHSGGTHSTTTATNLVPHAITPCNLQLEEAGLFWGSPTPGSAGDSSSPGTSAPCSLLRCPLWSRSRHWKRGPTHCSCSPWPNWAPHIAAYQSPWLEQGRRSRGTLLPLGHLGTVGRFSSSCIQKKPLGNLYWRGEWERRGC